LFATAFDPGEPVINKSGNRSRRVNNQQKRKYKRMDMGGK